MKYHEGECEVCMYSAPKPLDHVTFVCKADTGRIYGTSDIVSKNNKAVRRCRYFKPMKESP